MHEYSTGELVSELIARLILTNGDEFISTRDLLVLQKLLQDVANKRPEIVK